MSKCKKKCVAVCLIISLLCLTASGCGGKTNYNDGASGDYTKWDGIGELYSMSEVGELQELLHHAVNGEDIYFDRYTDGEGAVYRYNNDEIDTIIEIGKYDLNIKWMVADENGIWTYEDYSFSPEGPPPFHYLKNYSLQGELLLSVVLDDFEGYSAESITEISANGGYVYVNFQKTIIVLDKNGDTVGKIEPDGIVNLSMVPMNGKLTVLYGTAEGKKCIDVQIPSLSISDPYSIDVSCELLCQGFGEYSYLAYNAEGIYGVLGNSGETRPLVIWEECGIRFTNLPQIYTLTDNSFLYINRDGMKASAYVLKKSDTTPIIEKTTLVLEAFFPNSILSYYVTMFNEQSEEYYVQLNDLSTQFSTLEDRIRYLNTRLITQTGPDMICFGGLMSAKYGQNGFLLDLYDFIDNDGDVSRDDYIALSAFETDESLYVLAPGFFVQTYLGSEAVFGQCFGWTFDEFFDMENALTHSQRMLFSATKESFLEASVYGYINSAIDWKKGACDFDNETFKTILKTANRIEAFNTSDSNLAGMATDYPAEVLLSNGIYRLMPVLFTNIYDFAKLEKSAGCNLFPVGWPSANGDCGSSIESNTEIGVSADSISPEGCWEFIKFITRDESFYESTALIPISKAAFEWQMYALQNPFHEFDPDDVVIGENGGFYADDVFYDLKYDTTAPVTDRQAQIMYSLIQKIKSVNQYNTAITNIILDDASSYFYGGASIEDTVKSIEKRTAIYINEQK